MNILFYSTSSGIFDSQTAVTKSFPFCAFEFEQLSQNYPEHSFIIATQLPGMFLVDTIDQSIFPKAKNIRYELISFDEESKIADFLTSLKPDLAIASTFYVTPFDWLTAKDALVAKYLRQNGIKTLCHNLNTALACFDKWHTHTTLEQLGINVPKAIYINHSLFINAGNRKTVKSNVYKTALLEQIKELNFPLVIKDTTGLSSYGMDVLETFAQVNDWLKSKKFTSDRIIEEFIQGEQFGAELESIYNPETGSFTYKILPPFIFSVNKYGITSPKQSIKAGPVTSAHYNLPQLNSMLLKIAQKLNFQGLAQFDLVFNGTKWFVIEINPRLSGLTHSCNALKNIFMGERLFSLSGLSKNREETQNFVLNIKFSLLQDDEFTALSKMPYIKHIYQVENKKAQQLRERGYCEVILFAKTKPKLQEALDDLYKNFAQKTEESFYKKAKELLNKL